MTDLHTPSYGATARTVKRKPRRAHGPLGVAVPATDDLNILKWTGPVERRDPATYRLRSEVQTWMCRSCRTWTYNGAYKVGRCNICHHPRPSPDADPWS